MNILSEKQRENLQETAESVENQQVKQIQMNEFFDHGIFVKKLRITESQIQDFPK